MGWTKQRDKKREEYWALREKYQDACKRVEELERDSKEWLDACELRDCLQKQYMQHEMHNVRQRMT